MTKHKIGDEVWVRGTITVVDESDDKLPYKVDIGCDMVWFEERQVAASVNSLDTTQRTAVIDGVQWTRIDQDDPDEKAVLRDADDHLCIVLIASPDPVTYVRTDHFDAELAKRKPTYEAGWYEVTDADMGGTFVCWIDGDQISVHKGIKGDQIPAEYTVGKRLTGQG